MDVARDFAHCSAVAVDLVPMQSMYVQLPTSGRGIANFHFRYMPPNLR